MPARWSSGTRRPKAILIRAMASLDDSLPDGQEIVVYKNNSDGKGNSYGCHENYLMDRDVRSPASSPT